jgi:hypothetical protein
MLKIKPLALAAVAAVAMQAAHADTVIIDDFVFTPATSVTVASPNFSGPAGQFKGLLNGNSFVTYCTDLLQSFAFDTLYNNYSVVSGVTAWGATKANDLNKLMSAAINAGVPVNAAESAAIQAAVWEVLYETSGTYDLGAGSFTATSSDLATQGSINSVNWAGIMAGPVTHTVDQLYSRENQDFLVITQIPEPGTYALMLAGLAAVVGVARRRRQEA